MLSPRYPSSSSTCDSVEDNRFSTSAFCHEPFHPITLGITATLDFDGSKCAYMGILSESYHGFMDCGREGSLPLRLWTK
jgi:hypothetical protein